MTFFQNNLYKSLRIGLDDYMLNLTPFFRLNGLAKLSLNSLATHAIFFNFIDFSTALFLQFVFNTHLSLYRSITVKKILFKKRIPLVAVFGYDFFRTVTKTIMSSMIKPPDSNSNSNNTI